MISCRFARAGVLKLSPRSQQRGNRVLTNIRNRQDAPQTIGLPIEFNGSLQLTEHGFYDARPEPLLLRGGNGRASLLDPPKGQLAVRRARPFDPDFAIRNRKRTVFCGVGGELVYGDRKRLRFVWFQQALCTLHDGSPIARWTVGRKLLSDEVMQLSAGPARAGEERMGVGKRADAPLNGALKIVCALGP